MQFISSLIAGAAVASAAVIPARDTAQTFDISAFSMSGTPHSVVAYYNVNVTKSDGTTAEPIQCSTSTNTSPSVSPFELTACQNPLWSFSWTAQNTSQGTGYSLKVTHLPTTAGATNETACLWMPSSDVKLYENPGGPTGNVYYVDYPSSFQMTWSNLNECVYN